MDFALFAPDTLWTVVFCALLCAHIATRTWLSQRQTRHVLAHRNQVPEGFAGHISLDKHQKAAAYTVARLRFQYQEMVWQALCLLGWTLFGGLETLQNAVQSRWGTGWPADALLVAGFFATHALLQLPLAWWRTFGLEQSHGFNRMGLVLWLQDGAKAALLALGLGLPLLVGAVWALEQLGPNWWYGAWGGWVLLTLSSAVVYPTWIAPLFNRFSPLPDTENKRRIESLMQRCGFQSKGLYVVDQSKRSARANAYFTGLGPAKRVVFFDTLLQKLTPDELEAVLAHELGHFHHRHLWRHLWRLSVLALLFCWGWGQLSEQLWFYTGLGVRPQLLQSNHAMALLLFFVLSPWLGLWLNPWLNHGLRACEFEADAYACRHAKAQDLRSALLKLYQDNANTLTPDALYARFYHSHPPATERLARLTS